MELGPKQKTWIAALRSGKYKQGQGYLFDNGGYCCLGVAAIECCEMRDSDILHRENLFEIGFALKTHDKCGSFMSASIPHNNAEYHSLTEANDGGVPFSVIADFIEKYPKSVFKEAA